MSIFGVFTNKKPIKLDQRDKWQILVDEGKSAEAVQSLITNYPIKWTHARLIVQKRERENAGRHHLQPTAQA